MTKNNHVNDMDKMMCYHINNMVINLVYNYSKMTINHLIWKFLLHF
jgi:hypothetical protein